MIPTTIEDADGAADYTAARELMREYAAGLGVDLCFQNFAAELADIAAMYAPPSGALLLARSAQGPLGCVALRAHSSTVCEMKRLYVRPAARGQGLGQSLATAIVERARRTGYRRMVLDTLEPMHAARRVYAALGFRECAPYYDNPLPGAIYLSLELAS